MPDAVIESLQNSRELEQGARLQRNRLDALQGQQLEQRRQQRRYRWLATGALILAATFTFPDSVLPLAEIPLIAWLLAGLALALLWRGDTGS